MDTVTDVNPDGSIDTQPGEYAPGSLDQGEMDETKILLIALDDQDSIFVKRVVTVFHDLSDAEIREVATAVAAGAAPDISFDYVVDDTISGDFESPLSEKMSPGQSTKLAFHLDIESWRFDRDKITFTLKEQDPYEQFWALAMIDDETGHAKTLRLQNLNSVAYRYLFNLHVEALSAPGDETSVLALTIDPELNNDGDRPAP